MTHPNLNRGATRSSWRRPLVCVTIVILVAVIAVFSIRAYNSVFRSFEIFSAVWITHDLLVAHMNHTNGNWPSDWDDLDPYFTSINRGYGLPNLAWVRDRVHIDFDFDPTSLDSSIATKGNAVWAIHMADGSENGEIRNANERIRSFAINRQSPSSTP